MKPHLSTLLLLAVTGWHGSAMADNKSMEERIRNLEQSLQAQETAAPGKLEINGLVEVEAGSSDGDSDITVAKAELNINTAINERVSAALVLLYEEDATPLGVDAATITVAASEALSITAGQTAVPFGRFDSSMISDPLTLEMAETRATILQLDYTVGALSASAYAFNGTQAGEEIDNYGVHLGYQSDTLGLGLGYIANIGDSDTIAAETLDGAVPAIAVNASYRIGDLTLLGEYLAALKEFKAGDQAGDTTFASDAMPSTVQLELAYAMGKNTLAAGVQQSREAEALGLPESRLLATISRELFDNTLIALEVAGNEDYAGERTTSVTAQLAVEF
jgi:hypothetical protein